MNKRLLKYMTGKTGICLLFLCASLIPGIFAGMANAKPASNITILEGAANSASSSVGEEVAFTARYSAATPEGKYALHVCKTGKMTVDKFCQDGSWCVSDSFTADNPLACQYVTRDADTGNNRYFMFVCDNLKQCSAPFSGSFLVGMSSILSLEAPPFCAFKSVPFAFSPQWSAGNVLGDLSLTSISASNSGWSLDVTAAPWQNVGGNALDYAGDGVSTGQLTVNLDAVSIVSDGSIDGIRLGKTAAFSSAVKTVNIAAAGKKKGIGTFTLKNVRFDQFVPGNQQEGEYKTVLTFTIS